MNCCKKATLYLLLEDIKFLNSVARKIFFQTCLHALLNSLLLSVCFFSCKLLRYTQHCRNHIKHIYPRLMFAARQHSGSSLFTRRLDSLIFPGSWDSFLFLLKMSARLYFECQTCSTIHPIKGKQHRSTPLQWSSYTNQTLTESQTNLGLEMTSKLLSALKLY